MTQAPGQQRQRVMVVAVLASGAVAAAGFFSGTRTAPTPVHSGGSVLRVAPGVGSVPRHAELGRERRGPNAELYANAEVVLTGTLPSRAEPAQLGDRAQAVAQRAEHRAYDGAPPTIPHAIDQRGAPSCLVCHQDGARVGERVAPAMSHPLLSSCTQCHVVEADPRPLPQRTPPPVNEFSGLPSSGSGPRAWLGAPPQMPHGTAMRERCISCHGPAGQPGLRTSHPERDNCLQCHTATGAAQPRFPVQQTPPPPRRTP